MAIGRGMNKEDKVHIWASQAVLVVKNPPVSAGDVRDVSSVPGRSPGGGHGNPLQYSSLENPMDRGAWWATGHSVTESNITEKTACTRVHIYNGAIKRN